MDKLKIEIYQHLLSEERVRLTRTIHHNRMRADEIQVEHTEDEGDLAIISHDRELLFSLNQSDVTRLNAIQEALTRIDQHQFGQCVNCDEDINDRRLIAVPWVALCLQCQEKAELEAATSTYMMAGADAEVPEF